MFHKVTIPGLLIFFFAGGAWASDPFPKGCPPGSGTDGWIEVGQAYDRCGNPVENYEPESDSHYPPLRPEIDEEVISNVVPFRTGDNCEGDHLRVLYDSGTHEWVCATVKTVVRKISKRHSR